MEYKVATDLERLSHLMHMAVSNVIKDQTEADLLHLAIDIMLHGCYNIHVKEETCTGDDDTVIDLVGPGDGLNG